MLVAILALGNAHALEVAALQDTFNEARLHSHNDGLYQLIVLAEAIGPVPCASGLRLVPDATLGDAPELIDTFIVVGTSGTPGPSPALADWIRRHAPSARRYGSVSTGAFPFGAAGLLDG